MGKGKWDPWRGMDDFRQQVERMLDEAQAGSCSALQAGYVWTPLADVLETPQAVIIQVELPDVTLEQVLVEIIDGDLVVRGERPCVRPSELGASDAGEAEPVYHLLERAHGTFARRFPLPAGVDGLSVTARLLQGLLTITVPKVGAKSAARFRLTVE